MNTKKFSEAMNEIDNKYLEEAIRYQKKVRKYSWIKWGAIAACLAMILTISGMLVSFKRSMVVSASAYGTDEKITEAGAVINTGTIADDGEMTGQPLRFYLSGKDIATVRFSCKKQKINFMDWTEKRDEYGNAQNFTVAYGEDESEYYYLTVEWVPDTIIRELTDNAKTTITTLPKEMREDIIVMEITFANGKSITKAISVRLLEDGTFFAAFDDYKITEKDKFISRPDSKAIPRDIICNAQGNFSVSAHTDSITETNNQIVSDKITSAENAAKNYYTNTVFKVESMNVVSQTEKEIVFSVCVSKGGIPQEPNRTMTLRLSNATWEVVSEGY